ncbi:MAG: hypothetical protein LBV30_05105 [Propionibacteriaceae bacterium]|jgi:hypothetical protein|nr:hypothetical protein [Propionibacteriaceae bacterium]
MSTPDGYILDEEPRRMLGDLLRQTGERDHQAGRRVLAEVDDERDRQHSRWGDQSQLPDGTGPDELHHVSYPCDESVGWTYHDWRGDRQSEAEYLAARGTLTFAAILQEEVAEALAESDPGRLRAELIQVAAVAVQWVEAIDTRLSKA